MEANPEDASLIMFDSLFTYYKTDNEKTDHDLKKQLNRNNSDNGMYCLHYLAKYGDPPSIKKVWEINPDAAKVLRDDDIKSPLDYMRDRPELENLVLQIDPPAIVEIVQVDTSTDMKEQIIGHLTTIQTEFKLEKDQVQQALNNRGWRRNRLALAQISDHVTFIDKLKLDTLATKDNEAAFVKVKLELETQRDKTKELVGHYDYHTKWSSKLDNEYALYEHNVALEAYTRGLGFVDALNTA